MFSTIKNKMSKKQFTNMYLLFLNTLKFKPEKKKHDK